MSASVETLVRRCRYLGGRKRRRAMRRLQDMLAPGIRELDRVWRSAFEERRLPQAETTKEGSK